MLSRLAAALSLTLFLGACSDSSSAPIANPNNPKGPITRPDDKIFDPGDPTKPVAPGLPKQPPPDNPGGNPVPEPGTMLLVGSGLAGLAMYYRRRKSRDTHPEV